MRSLNLILFIFQLSIELFGKGADLYKTITVPIDHNKPNSGNTIINYKLGATFSTHKPTVFIIANAQQFYIRKWIKAYRIFSWEQYVNDINEVRKKLVVDILYTSITK